MDSVILQHIQKTHSCFVKGGLVLVAFCRWTFSTQDETWWALVNFRSLFVEHILLKCISVAWYCCIMIIFKTWNLFINLLITLVWFRNVPIRTLMKIANSRFWCYNYAKHIYHTTYGFISFRIVPSDWFKNQKEHFEALCKNSRKMSCRGRVHYIDILDKEIFQKSCISGCTFC